MGTQMRRLCALLVAVAALLATASGVVAAPPETETFHFKNETSVEQDVNPCSGVPGEVTTTASGVFHATEFTEGKHAGEFHVTGTVHGTFVFVPDDPAEPTFTGRFTNWFGANQNQKNFTATDTFSVTGKGSDGSHLSFSAVAHITVNANGDVTVEFVKERCNA